MSFFFASLINFVQMSQKLRNLNNPKRSTNSCYIYWLIWLNFFVQSKFFKNGWHFFTSLLKQSIDSALLVNLILFTLLVPQVRFTLLIIAALEWHHKWLSRLESTWDIKCKVNLLVLNKFWNLFLIKLDKEVRSNDWLLSAP